MYLSNKSTVIVSDNVILHSSIIYCSSGFVPSLPLSDFSVPSNISSVGLILHYEVVTCLLLFFILQVSNTKPGAGCIDPRSQWNLGSVMIISISLVLLLALLPPSDASECTLKRSLHTVRFRRCVPKRVRSLNCHGACTSYSSLNPQNLFSIVRNCSCCKETGFRNGRIALRCPKPSGRRGYRTAYVRVKVPTGCSCRPCDSVPTIQPGEFL